MTSVAYRGVGKGIALDGSEFFNFYGEDFNPNVPSLPSRTTASAYGETSSFNLSGFQPGNEVGCYVRQINLTENGRLYVEMDLQYYSGGWQTCWDFSWRTTVDIEDYNARMGYAYFGIDDDEIWTYSNQYRIVMNWEFTVGGVHVAGESGLINTFSINSLSIDSTRHSAGYFWVEGNYLCYVDGVWGNRGFKHKINYDSWYDGGTGRPGCVRIPSSSSDNHIYYVASNGTVRRTHLSSQWYGGSYYPSGARPGAIRVSNGSYEDGYGYLCYINGGGQARRMGNGAP